VVCQLGDSNRGVVCLRTWNPRRASEPYVPYDEYAEDGVTTSGYDTEYAWQVRAVGYSLVGDEVIPSNVKNTSLAYHVDYGMPAACVSLPPTASRSRHHGGLLPGHM